MAEPAVTHRAAPVEHPGFWLRHGGQALLGLVAVIGLFGVGDIALGLQADPGIARGLTGLSPEEIRQTSPPLFRMADHQARGGGLQLVVMSLLWATLVRGPFRRGERWAWRAMWTFPCWAMAVAVSYLLVELEPDVAPPPPAISGWVFLGLSALLLVATRRGFPATTSPKARRWWGLRWPWRAAAGPRDVRRTRRGDGRA